MTTENVFLKPVPGQKTAGPERIRRRIHLIRRMFARTGSAADSGVPRWPDDEDPDGKIRFVSGNTERGRRKSWPDGIKLFKAVIYDFLNKLERLSLPGADVIQLFTAVSYKFL
jgi:hypothetical protein